MAMIFISLFHAARLRAGVSKLLTKLLDCGGGGGECPLAAPFTVRGELVISLF